MRKHESTFGRVFDNVDFHDYTMTYIITQHYGLKATLWEQTWNYPHALMVYIYNRMGVESILAGMHAR
jgi:hypothetical protein